MVVEFDTCADSAWSDCSTRTALSTTIRVSGHEQSSGYPSREDARTGMATHRQMAPGTSYIKAPVMTHNYRRNIPNRIMELATENPDRVAFVFREVEKPRQTLTRKELLDGAAAMARYFIRQGICVGDKVAVLFPSGKTWMTVQFGLYMAGAIAVNSLSHDVEELQKLAKSLGCAAAVVGTRCSSGSTVDSRKTKLSIICFGKYPSDICNASEFVVNPDNANTEISGNPSDANIELPVMSADSPVVMFATSGSTGAPKLVVHTHTTILLGSFSFCDGHGLSDKDILLHDRPMEWGGGFPFAFLGAGSAMVYVISHLDSAQDCGFFVDAVLTEKATSCIMMEYRLTSLYKEPDLLPKMPRLRNIITGGHRVTHTHIDRLLRFCEEAKIGYGSTECLHFFCGTFTDTLSFEDGTAGSVTGGCEVKIVNKLGETVPVSEKGEAWLRGEACAKEYLLLDGTSRSILDADGWYHTNDVGFLNAEGMLVIKGRTTETIKRATVKIFPSVVERKLREALDVLDIAVVGVPDERLHQEICACVLLKPDSTLSRDEIRQRALEVFKPSLAPDGLGYMPGHFLILDSFPRTSSSKCNRPVLTQMATDILKSQG